MSAAIELRGVSKQFTKYVDTPMLLTSMLRFRPGTRRDRIWAVQDLDLDVAPGESFGVIGRNGSGKSTLMTLMAGITAPSRGSVRVRGRVAPLIAVGVGFHRELTGRENVYVNGSILGLSRRQIDRRLESIVDFAEVGSFIDTPVKFYSSGMFVRLGFAVAIHAEPEVLIVDEVLAVGDMAFQVKCYDRMKELRSSGATVVMVSHALGAVRRMCERVLLLDRGRPVAVGTAEEAIAAYHDVLSASREITVGESGLRHEPDVVKIGAVEVLAADERGCWWRTGHVEAGTQVRLRVEGTAVTDLDDLVVALTVLGADGSVVYADSTAGHPFGAVGAGECFTALGSFCCRLPTGTYEVAVRVDRADLRTTLAFAAPVSFFVTGRNTVAGLADLETAFAREESGGTAVVHDPSSTAGVASGSLYLS
ncbi:MAG: ABC transporter ATP-binding protein [Acidobacteriota bacterium]|nr:ABC transporter ATP-binding protein [Acidobacteriota bacterium]